MRRSALLFLCSIAPGGTLAGCFGSSSTPPAPDGGIGFDASGNDATFHGDAPSQGEAGADVRADAPGDAGDSSVDAPLDSPIDAPATGQFPTTPLDFGPVNCGSAPTQTQTYAFTNTGGVPITYSASVGTSTQFSIQSGAAGTVAPGSKGSIVVASATVPATSNAGTALTGTLTLTTDVPGSTLVAVPLKVTPQGGSITLTPTTAGFNTVDLSVQAPDIPLTITNAGNAPVGISLGTPTDPQFAVVFTGSPGPVTVAPGATLPGAAARFKPTATGLQSATAAIQTTGVLCASPASSIAMNGTGTTQPVTAGPSPLDFGLVPCGTQSTQVLPVTISNGYSFVVNYTTTLAAGTSLYSLDAPTGSVPAGGTATIHVTPLAVPSTASVAPGAFDDTLTINTDAPGSPSSTIALQETAQGAVLGLTMPSGGFSTVVAGSTGTLPFNVTNAGNIDAPITLTPSGPGFGAVFTGTSTATAGGGAAPGNATFTPSSAGTVSGSLSVGTTVTQCQAPPAAVQLSGTGVGPVATYATAALSVTVTCGGGASNVATLTITNNTAYPLTAQGSSQYGLFGFTTPTSITIPANSSGYFTIQAPAVAIGAKAAGMYSDYLLFTTNEFGSPTHSVQVSVTVSGANLSATPTVNYTTCGVAQPITVSNTGNAAATVTQPVSNGTVNWTGFGIPTAPQPSATIQAGNSASTGAAFEHCGNSSQVSTFTTSGPVCQESLSVDLTWNVVCQGSCC
jgi:hypothetical protein